MSINNTQRALDRTTLRLATGLRVNSALDNPQNFFAASSLDNRANDLQRLLDGLSQNIQTIKEAEIGTTALTSLIEQANSIAQQAVELTALQPTEAKIVGDVDLSSTGNLIALAGINVGDQIIITRRAPDSIVYFPPPTTITITANTSAEQLAANINTAVNAGLSSPAVDVRLDGNGQFTIKSLNGDIVNIRFNAAAGTDSANLNLAAELGFSDLVSVLGNGVGANEVQITIVAQRSITSFQLFEAVTNRVARRSDRISTLEGANNTLLFFGLNSPADTFEIGVNGGARQSILLDNTQTVQGLIDAINNNPTLSQNLEADFNEETGQLIITAINPEVESIETGLIGDALVVSFFGFNATLPFSVANSDVDSIHLGTVSGPTAKEVNSLENDYNKVLTQIDNIVEDAHFRGINLLKGDDLTSFFNEDLTSTLVTEGVDFTASGLGLARGNFQTQAGAQIAVDKTRGAVEQVRDFGQSIATSLSIIQNRRDFSLETINTLTAGADDLTIADLNEEGSNLLALQTRQSLAVTVLSLVGQSQRSILRLF